MKLLSPSVSTKHPTSEESLHPKSFQSWRWVFLAAILLAAVTISTFYFSSAQAQGDDGAITGLTLTSTTAGTLTVSWDAASPVPTDYRVDWAKSSEDYKSWKVDDGHIYTAETDTTTTITDLSHDTEYKIRMRARYYRGEHEGKSWGGPWAEATITVAGEPAETPTPEPSPEPTPAPGTIDTLAATADDTGQLLLTWTAPAAPNATPTDYHVNWAKSAEDYPADNTPDGNDHPTDTTLTLTVLEFDTDYKIRVRARYSDGENAASPWNGPWTETTARVKLPLPMAINMMGTGVSPKNQVILFWQHPSNDSITGYQILRGPKADSLVVIEDDTGSSSTSYTDTAPPAGQTHTYAVKARNSAGLSPLSNTLTATVPEAEEEEEVLITARHESVDNTLVSNLGQAALLGYAQAGSFMSNHHETAMPFTTSSNAFGYHLSSIQLNLRKGAGSGILTPQVSIREDNAGLPGETVLSTFTTSTAITNSYQLITLTTSGEVTLQPNTLYWLHVNANIEGRLGVQQTASDDEDTESQAGWSIGDHRVIRIDGGAWTTDNKNLQMRILGHVAPTLVSNLGQAALLGYAQAGSFMSNHHETAMPFTTGTNTPGYRLSSIQLNLRKGAGSGILTPQVSIREDNAGLPGETVLSTFTTSTAITNSYQLITFTTSGEVTLQPNTLYWLHVNANIEGRLGVQQTASDDEDTESQAGWSIGDHRVIRIDGGAWTTDNKNLQMRILGHVAPPLVSNLEQPAVAGDAQAGFVSGNHHETAMPFTTGTNTPGYRLSSIQLNLRKGAGSGILTPQVSIRGDNAGTPGEIALYDFYTSTAITSGYQLITFTTSGEVTLQPNTLYWLHVNANIEGRLGVQQTASDDEDTKSQVGWSIGDHRVSRIDGGTWTTDNKNLQMKILGHVIILPTLVSNLEQPAVAGDAQAGFVSGNHHETAMPFTTGTNTPGYRLSSIQLNLRKGAGSGILTPQVSIREDNAGLPGETVLSTFTTSTAITSGYQLITFTTSGEVTLRPDTLYWLHVNANIEGRLEVQQTASNDEDTESQAGWSIGDHRVNRIDGGAWTTDNKNLQMKILGRVITPTLVSNLEQPAVAGDAQAGFVSGNHHETAMPFTTGSNAFGYHPTSIQLYLSRLSGSPLVYITIREDNAGLPGETNLARLNMSTAITADANIPQLITFTTSGEVTLQPDTLYWLHVNASTSRAPAGVRQTASDDEDTESQADWRIGDHRVSRIDGGAWTTPTSLNSLRMRILGHIILPTIVDLSADITTTARLAVNESVTGQHEHGRDVDWFAFAAEADTNYQFTANQGQKFATLNVLRIFQDDGTELRNSLIAKKDNAYHAVDRLNNIAFRTDTASTYYVSIEGWHGGGSNVPYTITMFDDDYSDDITTTGVVDVGESFQNYVMRTGANPESSRTDDVDWIRVALKADVTYEIVYDVACLHQGRIEGIYGPDGTLLPDTTLDWPRKTKGWCTDLTTEFTPSSDDDYYIAVSAQGSHFPIGSVNPFQGVQGTLTITAK